MPLGVKTLSFFFSHNTPLTPPPTILHPPTTSLSSTWTEGRCSDKSRDPRRGQLNGGGEAWMRSETLWRWQGYGGQAGRRGRRCLPRLVRMADRWDSTESLPDSRVQRTHTNKPVMFDTFVAPSPNNFPIYQKSESSLFQFGIET